MAILSWGTLEGIIILLCWVLIIVLAQHRVDRPPGLRIENLQEFMQGFKAKNYDTVGKRILPFYAIAYALMIIVSFSLTC